VGRDIFVNGNKLYCLGGMKLHVHVEGYGGKSLAPTIAPKVVARFDENTVTVLNSPSSKKSTNLSAGTVNYFVKNALQFIYIVVMVDAYFIVMNVTNGKKTFSLTLIYTTIYLTFVYL